MSYIAHYSSEVGNTLFQYYSFGWLLRVRNNTDRLPITVSTIQIFPEAQSLSDNILRRISNDNFLSHQIQFFSMKDMDIPFDVIDYSGMTFCS